MRSYWRQRQAVVYFLIVFCLLFAFALTAISSSFQKSPTYDETVHLFSGYSYLKWGDFSANPEHPPLAKVLAALPLLALGVEDSRFAARYGELMPESRKAKWPAANQMFFSDNDAETLFFFAKFPMIGLAVLLGIFVYLWARELYGLPAGVAALLVYCLDPNILAHSPLIHTDLAFAAFFFIGAYFFWRALGRLTWSSLLFTSFFFSCSAMTKYSFLAIVPILAILGLMRVFSPVPQHSTITLPRKVSSRWGKATLLAVILGSALTASYLFVWAIYGFRFDPVSGGGTYHFPVAVAMPRIGWIRAALSFSLEHYLFPEAWIYGLLYSLESLGRSSYLLGQTSNHGFWLYFPVAFAVKTPLPTLIFLIWALILMLKRRDRMSQLFLLVPVVFYFAFAVGSRMNIGLRHILPIYPFLFVLIGEAVADLWRSKKAAVRAGLTFLALWYLWSSASIYPHYLAFFNELVGGPKNGYKVLVDSNLDWGQDLKGLKRWMDSHGVKRIYLAYFGTADPVYYGIEGVYLPGTSIPAARPQKKNPAKPEYVAISATHLSGVYLSSADRKLYDVLRRREPVATVGHSIFVYRLGSEKWP